MASFYEDASLVVIPSGYKTSKIYAEKPTDGSGDLTFTRASGATRVGANGLIEEVRTNLILQSNTFSTTWANSDSTETSGQAGYDGTNNAWRLTTTLSGGYIFQSVAIGGLTTFSIYAKAGTQNGIILYSAHVAQGINFNLSTGVVGAAFVAAPLGSRIESIGNGWYRCSITVSSSSTNTFRIYVSDGSNPSLGNALIQNSQVEAGDIATNYIPTTTAAVSVGPVSNVPRLDYLGSSCPRLLLEPQRTNLLTFSEQFDNAAWTKTRSTITANNSVSPDGYASADRITDTTFTANSSFIERTIGSTINTAYTYSCFVKAGTAPHVYIGIFDSINYTAIFNLSTGLNTFTTSGATSSITPYANGWYRISITRTVGTVTIYPYIGVCQLSNSITYNGTGAYTAQLWGAQLEAGAYATSYIPTLAASVTRVADDAIENNGAFLPTAYPFTLFVELEIIATNAGSGISFSNNASPSNYFAITYTTNIWSAECRPNGTNVIASGVGSSAAGRHKAAAVFTSTAIKIYVDGVSVATTTHSQAFNAAINDINLGFFRVVSDNGVRNSVRQALVFNRELTNAELAELTTL